MFYCWSSYGKAAANMIEAASFCSVYKILFLCILPTRLVNNWGKLFEFTEYFTDVFLKFDRLINILLLCDNIQYTNTTHLHWVRLITASIFSNSLKKARIQKKKKHSDHFYIYSFISLVKLIGQNQFLLLLHSESK